MPDKILINFTNMSIIPKFVVRIALLDIFQ